METLIESPSLDECDLKAADWEGFLNKRACFRLLPINKSVKKKLFIFKLGGVILIQIFHNLYLV